MKIGGPSLRRSEEKCLDALARWRQLLHAAEQKKIRGDDIRRRLTLPRILIARRDATKRRLGVLEVAARVAKVVVVEADPSFEDLPPRFGQIQLLRRIVQRDTELSAPGGTPAEAEAQCHD